MLQLSILNTVAGFFGISPLRVVIYAICIASSVGGAIVIREHYVNLGYNRAIADVKAKDKKAEDAANAVQQDAEKCTDTNGFWDVVTQNCMLGDK